MVNADTQQFMYRVFIGVFALVIVSMFGFMYLVAAVQGDGESVRMIQALEPIAFGAFLSMGGVLGVHQITSASVARATVNATGTLPAPAILNPPPPMPAPLPAPTPAPAPQADTQPAPASDL